MPCYNESNRLQGDEFISFIDSTAVVDLWFVNDGSKDSTLDVLNKLRDARPERIFVHDLQQNFGKAEAIRRGFSFVFTQNEYPYIGFIDADLSAPLEEMAMLYQVIRERKLLIASGARVKLIGKDIRRSLSRHYMGRIFATYYDTILKLGNYDTQCGLKLFEAHFATQIFDQPFISNWFFDIELFVRARRLLGAADYCLQIEEVPLNVWKEIPGSKLKARDFLKAPFEILKIYRKYKVS